MQTDNNKNNIHENNEHEHHRNHNGHSHHDHHLMMMKDFMRRFWVSTLLTIPVLLLSPFLKNLIGNQQFLAFDGYRYVVFGISSIIFFYGGYPFLKGFVDEMRQLKPGMMTLIALAISVAYFYSAAVIAGLEGKFFFWEIAGLIDVMLLGHWIEMKSVMSASGSLDELAKLMPDKANRVNENDEIEEVNVKELNIDDTILIKPGEKIPADGKVIEGETSVDESMITGESKLVGKKKSDNVVAGAVNGEQSIKVKVTKTDEETFLSGIINIVKEAKQRKSKSQNLADRAAFWLTVVAISAGIATFIAWKFLMAQPIDFALSRTVTVMVITCPHALGLAIPLVIATVTTIMAKKGLLMRNKSSFEKARKITKVVFDKTGTLTKGEFKISDIIVFSEDMTKEELVKVAASVEKNSEHPIGKAIYKETDDYYDVKDFSTIPGKGAKATVNEKAVKLVNPGYLKEHNIDLPENDDLKNAKNAGSTLAFIIIEDELSGVISLEDEIRNEAKEAVEYLNEHNIESVMLTGDNETVAKRVSDQLGISTYFAEVLPDKKVEKVKELKQSGEVIAMVGDGINDAPALTEADIGIAIGAGTDVAVESGDIVLVNSNPLDIKNIIEYSKKTYTKMIQNLFWATGYNVVAIPLAAGVLFSFGIVLSPAVGALLMSLSTVIVAINAKLLR